MRNLKHRSRSANRRVRKLLHETYDSKKTSPPSTIDDYSVRELDRRGPENMPSPFVLGERDDCKIVAIPVRLQFLVRRGGNRRRFAGHRADLSEHPQDRGVTEILSGIFAGVDGRLQTLLGDREPDEG